MFFDKFYHPFESVEVYKDCTVWSVIYESRGKKLEKIIMVKKGRHLWELNANLFDVIPYNLDEESQYEMTITWKGNKIKQVKLYKENSL